MLNSEMLKVLIFLGLQLESCWRNEKLRVDDAGDPNDETGSKPLMVGVS